MSSFSLAIFLDKPQGVDLKINSDFKEGIVG